MSSPAVDIEYLAEAAAAYEKAGGDFNRRHATALRQAIAVEQRARDAFRQRMLDQGYSEVQILGGKWVALRPFIFTVGICCGLDEHGYEYRYCYKNLVDAYWALSKWEVEGGDEPQGYIKRK